MNNTKLYDPVRKLYVTSFPEEVVRQKLLNQMINIFEFPINLLAIEKEICSLPHLKNQDLKLKKRRADIICFAKDIHPSYSIYPLLMIECKACPLTKKAIDQVLGYNYYVQAYFVAIANKNKIFTYWYDNEKKKYDFINFLPTFKQMLKSVKNG